MSLYQLLALSAVAVADIARTVWVITAILDTSRAAAGPWLAVALIVSTGGLSLALIGLVMRAVLEQRHAVPSS